MRCEEENKMLKLNVGCGDAVVDRPGWANVDLGAPRPLARARWVESDVSSLPFQDNSCSLVVASHVLEHLADPAKALKEWLRVLTPGGEVLVAVPDQSKECEWIAAHLATWHARGRSPLEEHRSEFTQASLEHALHMAGFVEVYAEDPRLRWELPGKALWQAVAKGVKRRQAVAA